MLIIINLIFVLFVGSCGPEFLIPNNPISLMFDLFYGGLFIFYFVMLFCGPSEEEMKRLDHEKYMNLYNSMYELYGQAAHDPFKALEFINRTHQGDDPYKTYAGGVTKYEIIKRAVKDWRADHPEEVRDDFLRYTF